MAPSGTVAVLATALLLLVVLAVSIGLATARRDEAQRHDRDRRR